MALIKCRECGKEVSSKAKTCPNCGVSTPKGSNAGVVIVIILCLFIIFIVANSGNDSSTGSSSSYSRTNRVNPQIEKTIQEWINKDVVQNVNIEFNEVRVDPLVWVMLPLENKQNFVSMFSQYFDSKGSTARVTVLSNRNDKKLATYDSWSGIKIIE